MTFLILLWIFTFIPEKGLKLLSWRWRVVRWSPEGGPVLGTATASLTRSEDACWSHRQPCWGWASVEQVLGCGLSHVILLTRDQAGPHSLLQCLSHFVTKMVWSSHPSPDFTHLDSSSSSPCPFLYPTYAMTSHFCSLILCITHELSLHIWTDLEDRSSVSFPHCNRFYSQIKVFKQFPCLRLGNSFIFWCFCSLSLFSCMSVCI